MSKRKYIINLLAATALLIGCNESLEDTYSDYSGDGKIRYVAKCSDVHATPRWERLLLEWKNGTDATIDKIKVIWTNEGVKDSVLLPKTSTSFDLNNLSDGSYRFDICAMDSLGNESLKETTYGRPYTKQHEIMLAFTRGIVKSYFVKNNMVFFSDQWNQNIVEMKLQYKDTKGDTQYYVFDKETSFNSFITIPDVSMNLKDTVYVLRKGKLEDCPDVIEFEPYAISRKRNYSAGFINAIERRYGYSTNTKEQEVKFDKFIDEVEELEFDYNMETFEDVLYCPNLKKLILGKNRYLESNFQYSTENDQSKLLANREKSIQILDKATELLRLTIDYYGNRFSAHYFGQPLRYMSYKGYPVLPAMEIIPEEKLKVLDENGNKILCSPSDPYAELKNLLDNNTTTRWATTSSTTPRRYEMMMELLEETEIRGIKVGQALYIPRLDKKTPFFMPSSITMQTSADGVTWENVTFLEGNELGRGSGEITLLPIAEGVRKVRYIKFSVRDGVDPGGICEVILGDVVLYK